MDDNKRNLILMFMDSILFTNAMMFLSVNAVITYFLSNLGASTFVIGLANAIVSIGAFISQPTFTKKVMNIPYKLKTFVKILFTQRIFFLLFSLSIPLFAQSHPQLMIVLFLICWAVFNYFTGSYAPFYISLFAKMVAVQQRGRLKGYSGAVANLLALGSAFLTGIILKEVAFPYNYSLLFSIGTIILLLDVLDFALMKEMPDQVTKFEINYFQYFRSIPRILRENKKFTKIVFGFTFIMISQVSLAYYALYAVRAYDAQAPQIALFTAIMGLINIIGNILFGILADKYSHRLILLLSSACGAIAGFFVIGVHELWAVYVAFALTNLCLSGYNLSSGILIIENVQKEKLPMYVSVNTMITLLVSSLVTVGSSFLVDSISFDAVFAIAGLGGVIGCLALYSHSSRGARFNNSKQA